MTPKKKNEILRSIVCDGLDLIIDHLGKDANPEIVIEVLQMMTANVLTAGGKLDSDLSLQNTETFARQLKAIIEHTQKHVPASGHCGRLM